jgi:Stress responsive A/B Barrel Domain
MYNLIALIHLDGDAAPVSEALVGLGAAVAPVMEGNFNGGDLSAVWSFADDAGYRAARPAIDAALAGAGVVRVDSCFFVTGQSGVSEPGLATGVHRTLFLCADHNATDERVAQFEAEMVQMAQYIPAIRNWRLSRVSEAGGELPWTHVWEQEYAGIGGLMGPYMLHPYHWAFIDRWFDHECPDWLVNLRLCHSFAMYGKAVLS